MNGNDPESKLDRFRLFAGLLQRYFNGKATQKEKQIIDTWDAQSAWEKHREKVDSRKMDAACDDVWNNISSQLQFEKKRKSIKSIQYLQRYAAAAVIFILFGGGILFFTQNNSFNRSEYGIMADANTFFQTSDTQIKQITLPDGSKIHLNRGTKVSYTSTAFNRKLREVWLSGEAFFDVAKNADKPFIIHSGDMTTTVRGTSFNVKAYPQLGENVVSVRTGKVEIATQNKVLALLTPGKQITYNASNGKSDTQEINLSEIAAWSDGRLVLSNASVMELKLRLKQQFGTELQIRGEALDSVKMNAVFYKDTQLKDVMETISGLYGIRYEITKSGNVIINN